MALPSAPVFLLHQTFKNRAALPPVGAAGIAAGGTAPGLVVCYDDVHERGVLATAGARGSLSPLIADPGGHRYGRREISNIPTASWIRRQPPRSSGEWDQTSSEAIQAQRALQTDALVIPTVELQSADWPNGLQRAVDAARRAFRRDHQPRDPDWFARFCVRDDWISQETLRRTLLQQVTDLPDEVGVALHVRWSRRDILTDNAALRALSATVTALADDDRKVLLLEAGLVGWLAIGWGAWGFTAGASQASWHDSTQPMGAQPGVPKPPRVEYYFERGLLTRVRRAEHLKLVGRAGYQACPCSFCGTLNPGGQGGWDHLLAWQHALYTLQVLTEQVAGTTLGARRNNVRNAVAAAATVAGQLQAAAPHLPIWLSHL